MEKSLQQLLKLKGIILADTSTRSLNSSWYREIIFKSKQFHEINSSELNKEFYSLVNNLEFSIEPNVKSVQGVVDEQKVYRDILREKLKFLNSKSPKSFIKQLDEEKLYNHNSNKSFLEEICYLQHRIYHRNKKSVWKPNNTDVYEEIKKMVLNISKDAGSKIDYSYRYEENPIEKKKDKYADEELVTSAIYRSLIEKEPTIILTRDSDIGRIATACTYHILHASKLGSILTGYPYVVEFLCNENKLNRQFSSKMIKSSPYSFSLKQKSYSILQLIVKETLNRIGLNK